MKVVILEEEDSSAQSLRSVLKTLYPEVKILAVLNTIEEASRFFQANKENVNLVFAAFYLKDGPSFSIFTNDLLLVPIVFITKNEE